MKYLRHKYTEGDLINGFKYIRENGFTVSPSGQRKRQVIAECPKCKKDFSIDLQHLKRPITKSCGCGKIKYIEGEYYNGFKFVKETETSKNGIRRGIVICKHCNKEYETTISKILGKKHDSCGCLRGENHGMSNTRIYRIWNGMINRCYRENINSYRYKIYQGKGITVCDEWKNSFTAFKNWAFANGYSEKLTIDRINGNRNYEPSNCRWATPSEQSQNLKSNKLNWDMVYEIRKLAGHMRQKELAELFWVTKNTIRMVVQNKYWVDNNLKQMQNV